MGTSDERLNLPFDRYQRYRIVADALGILREGSDPLEVLEIGHGEGALASFLPRDLVTVLDLSETERSAALPFEDHEFDYVVGVDVLGHADPEARDRSLSELRRAARRGVLLVGPFDSEAMLVLAAETGHPDLRRDEYERRLAEKEGALARKEAQVNDLSRRLAELVSVENARQVHLRNLGKVAKQKENLQRELEGVTGTRGWRLLTTVHELRLKVRRIFGSG